MAIAVASAAAFITLLTLAGVLRFSRFVHASAGVFVAFAAGALIAAALLHLVPAALAARPDAALWVLAGFAGAYFFNRGVLSLAHDPASQSKAAAFAAVAGVGLHSLIDGLTYAVTFAVDWTTGALTALGLVLHEAPEALIVYALLHKGGVRVGPALVITFVAAGLTTPLGAGLSGLFLQDLTADTLALLLAVAAGVVLFVGAGHLLPHVAGEPVRRAAPALLAGGAVVIAGLFLHTGHGHGVPGHAHAEELPGESASASRAGHEHAHDHEADAHLGEDHYTIAARAQRSALERVRGQDGDDATAPGEVPSR